MDDAEFSIGKLQRLKDLGIGFAIDDHGTGYSCLYYLKRMPVDILKIDGCFVSGLGKDPGDEAIVSGTIDLAHALGLRVVAEGVETAEQLAGSGRCTATWPRASTSPKRSPQVKPLTS